MKGMGDQAATQVSATRSFVAGCAAGVSGCIVGHPFDTVKLVQQTASTRRSLRGSMRGLLKGGGGHRAFWAGIGPALAVQVLVSGFMFGAQTSISTFVGEAARMLGAPPVNNKEIIPSEYRLQQAMAVSSVTCATVSGFLTGGLLSPLVCPLEAIKCRSQVARITGSHTGWALGGLYSGWSATVLRCSFGNAAFFGVYALAKQLDVNVGLAGAISGAAFWVAGMPFDVVKSRMQTALKPLGLMATLRQAQRQGGLRVLYAGLPVTFLRAVPMNAAVFVTYELVMAA